MYPWLTKPYQQLVDPVIHNRAHHGLLLNYTQGSGENELISLFINRLLCQSPHQQDPCGQCHSCLLFKAETHPDFYTVTLEKDKKSIGVEQIRQLTEKVYEHAQQGGAKVIWIKQASLMTEAAANALLKTLEEPPAQTFFILSDHRINQLPATVRSRCFYFYLSLPSLDDSIAWLKQHYQQYNDNQLATALLLNENAPLAALALLVPEAWQLRQQFCDRLSIAISENNFWALLAEINTDQAVTLINWFSTLLSDALKARSRTGKFVMNRDQVPLIRLLARMDEEKLIKLYQLWLQVQYQLRHITGLNQELIVSNLLAQSELVIS